MERPASGTGLSIGTLIPSVAAVAEHAVEPLIVVEARADVLASPIAYVNPAFARLTALDPDGVIGRALGAIFVGAVECTADALRERPGVTSLATPTASGEVRRLDWQVSALPDSRDQTVGWILRLSAAAERPGEERAGDDGAIGSFQQRAELATTSSLVGIWDWTVATGEIYLSPNLKALLGYAVHEIDNNLDDWSRHIHPDDLAKVGAMIERLLSPQADSDDFELEHRMVHKTGGEARGRAIYLSPNLKALLGYAVHEIDNNLDDWSRHIHPDDLAKVGAMIERLLSPQPRRQRRLRAGAPHGAQDRRGALDPGSGPGDPRCRRRSPSSSSRPFDSCSENSVILHKVSGRTLRVIGTDTDITSLKQAQDQLRRRGDEVRRLADAVPVLLAYCGTDERYRLVNSAYRGWFGRAPSDIVGMTISQLLGAPAYARLRGGIVRALAGDLVSFDERLELPIAGEKDVALVFVPHRDSHGDVAGFYAVMQDVGRLKSAERALRQAKDEAERASRAKSRFLAAASHDMRQPLHALEFLLAALANRDLPADTGGILADIEATVGAMGRMLNTLLDLSELEAGAVAPQVGAFPINALLSRMRREYRHAAEAKALDLRVVPCGAVVDSDRDLLERIVGNFMSNAIRYTRQGRVLLGCRRRGRNLRIEVWDSGPGIVEQQVELLFEEFRKLEAAGRDSSQGLGLGLAIVKRLAALLSHEVHVASTPGKGSLFSVDVPLRPPTRPAWPAPRGSRAILGELSDTRVIVIEDDTAVARATERFLQSWGCRVVCAKSGEQALSELNRGDQPPDLIIADYQLPERRNGIEAIERLQAALNSAIPALIITGDTSAESLHQLSNSGYSVLRKPVRPAKLRALVRHLLSGEGGGAPEPPAE